MSEGCIQLRSYLVVIALLIAFTQPVLGQERPDTPRALDFFHQVQQTVRSNDRDHLANMINYQVYVFLHGKRIRIHNRKVLLRNFDLVFDPEVRCAILNAKDEDIRAHKFGFIVHLGEINFERLLQTGDNSDSNSSEFWTKGTFKIRAVHNGLPHKFCDEKVD